MKVQDLMPGNWYKVVWWNEVENPCYMRFVTHSKKPNKVFHDRYVNEFGKLEIGLDHHFYNCDSGFNAKYSTISIEEFERKIKSKFPDDFYEWTESAEELKNIGSHRKGVEL